MFEALHRKQPRFDCPVCGYEGPFRSRRGASRVRRHAACAECGSLERHRLQYLVIEELAAQHAFGLMAVLHVAPEPFFRQRLSRRFARYETADLSMPDVDHRVDLTGTPFPDSSYDALFASHVLEHIVDDMAALREVYRLLTPGGFAILPVPLNGDHTVEYPAPNPHECGHVRAPGYDYFERYRSVFDRVELYRSTDFPARHQLLVYEDRSAWPVREMPLRPTTPGQTHVDVIPICYRD